MFHKVLISQLPDLNRVPARYEGAALPGELSWLFNNLIIAKSLCQFNESLDSTVRLSSAIFAI